MPDLTPVTFTIPDADGLPVVFKGYKDADNNFFQPLVVAGRDGTLAEVDSLGRLSVAPSGDFAFAQDTITGASVATYSAGKQVGAAIALSNTLFALGGGAFGASAVTVKVADGTKLLDSPAVAILVLDIGTTDNTTFDMPFAAAGALQLYLPLTKTVDVASLSVWEATLPAGGLLIGGVSVDLAAVLVSATTGDLPSTSPDIAVQMGTVRI